MQSFGFAQIGNADTANVKADTNVVDIKTDTLINDTASVDSIQLKANGVLEAPVKYAAQDSIVYNVANQVIFLYDSSSVDYKKLELDAYFIEMDLENNELTAFGKVDTFGVHTGDPVFSEGEESFQATQIRYNFDTRQGLIKDAFSNRDEIYLHGKVAKKKENVIYIKDAKFTTCSRPDPHFHIATTRAKFVKDEIIVTGAANLQIEHVPTPIVLPFGFFPDPKNRTHGIILPQIGSGNFGFGFTNFGYYIPFSNKIDLTLYGDIYTSLSFGIKAVSNYKIRYKSSGNIEIGYSNFRLGDPALKGTQYFSVSRDFRVLWNHTQDPKANPTIRFASAVEVASGSYNKLNGQNVSSIVENQLNSNISFSKSFRGTPFSLSLYANFDQNISTGRIFIQLPRFLFNVQRFYPFKRKNRVGAPKWYENIGIDYSLSFNNQITTFDSLIGQDPLRLLSDSRNGFLQQAGISTSLKVFRFFSLTPSINYKEIWNFQNTKRSFNSTTNQVDIDTLSGFFTGRDVSANLALTTNVYGMYRFNGGPVTAMRHRITPQVSFSYRPDLGDQITGFYGNNGDLISYSPNAYGVYGAPTSGESGVVSLSVQNNLEMKVKSRKDTIDGLKKVSIFDYLNFGISYNIAADSLNLSNLSIRGRTSLFKDIVRINYDFSFDPYAIQQFGNVTQRINQLQVTKNGAPLRFTYAKLAFNLNYQAKPKNADETKKLNSQERSIIENLNTVNFNIPFSLSLGYNLIYSKPLDRSTITQTINVSGDFNITSKWKIAFNMNYDIKNTQFTTSSIDIYRNLHCWEMNFKVIPFGLRKSFLFTIRVKSPLLQALKLNRRGGGYPLSY